MNRRIQLLFIPTVLVALISSVAAQPTPTVPTLSTAQVEQLNGGEVIVQIVSTEIPTGWVLGVVDVPPQRAFDVISDFQVQSEIFESMAESSVIGQDGEFKICHGVTDTPWPMEDRVWDIRQWCGEREVDGVPAHLCSWSYVEDSGNMVDNQGYWLFLPWGDDGSKSLVQFYMILDLGTWIPDVFIEWSTEEMLPNNITELREHFDD